MMCSIIAFCSKQKKVVTELLCNCCVLVKGSCSWKYCMYAGADTSSQVDQCTHCSNEKVVCMCLCVCVCTLAYTHKHTGARERDYTEISAVYAMQPHSNNPFNYPSPWQLIHQHEITTEITVGFGDHISQQKYLLPHCIILFIIATD